MKKNSFKEIIADNVIEKDKVTYKSKTFIGILITILGLFLLNNVIVLFQTGALLNLLPITVQSALLFLIISKHDWVRLGVKAWAMLMIIAGGSKILALILRSVEYNMSEATTTFSGTTLGSAFMMVFQLVVGCIYFFLAKRYIETY